MWMLYFIYSWDTYLKKTYNMWMQLRKKITCWIFCQSLYLNCHCKRELQKVTLLHNKEHTGNVFTVWSRLYYDYNLLTVVFCLSFKLEYSFFHVHIALYNKIIIRCTCFIRIRSKFSLYYCYFYWQQAIICICFKAFLSKFMRIWRIYVFKCKKVPLMYH